MSLKIDIIKKKEYAYSVALEGSLDTDTYLDLKGELEELVDDKTRAVILDMQNLTYISSAGVGIVMWAKKAFKQKNTTFAMVNLKPQIEKVFEAMKILPIVSIFEDMEEADKYIDQIIKEPLGGAHSAPEEMAKLLKRQIKKAITELQELDPDTLIQQRIDKYSKMGQFDMLSPEDMQAEAEEETNE